MDLESQVVKDLELLIIDTIYNTLTVNLKCREISLETTRRVGGLNILIRAPLCNKEELKAQIIDNLSFIREPETVRFDFIPRPNRGGVAIAILYRDA